MSSSTIEKETLDSDESIKKSPKITFELSTKIINHGERKGTSFKINAELHKLLKACAALKDRQEGDLVNEAIADLLVKYGYLDVVD